MRILVQQQDFDIREEMAFLRGNGSQTGAITTFTGLVRDLHGDEVVEALFLEHYPGMTERSLQDIATEASEKWQLQQITLIHRIGHLKAGEQIVFVGVSSAHRKEAFEACEFLMDYLKTTAPFWKKSIHPDEEVWVEAKDSDTAAALRWKE